LRGGPFGLLRITEAKKIKTQINGKFNDMSIADEDK
jgi:hypothetical protein